MSDAKRVELRLREALAAIIDQNQHLEPESVPHRPRVLIDGPCARIARRVLMETEATGAVTVHINGEKHSIPNGGRITYERLVELSGRTGYPTMTISFGDRDRAGRAPRRGQTIDLDEGAIVTVCHTNNA